MSNILLAKPQLPPDWIDVSVGEPHLVRENLLQVFDLTEYKFKPFDHMYEYPNPTGYSPLVQLLESKHKAPVIITNGAKQALGAAFYALKKLGKNNVGMRLPYWALIPPLASIHGMDSLFVDPALPENLTPKSGFDSYLLVAPNNPDGWCPDAQTLKDWSGALKDAGIPFIHDAAYYTHIYLPETHLLPAVGDVQIYSISKMLGLSGLRLGYVVCRNPEYYKLIMQYMEDMTVGVSIISQMFLFDLLSRMNSYPTLRQRFEGLSSNALAESRKIVKQLDPEILEVNSDLETTPGMFGWFKVGPKADFEKSKINFIDGALFGVPGMVRMNLAFSKERMEEIVRRLNSVKEVS